MRRALAVAWLAFAGAAMAQAPSLPMAAAAPRGEAEVAGELRDPDFGVRTRAAGLQRQVEMYQWRRSGARYVAGWSRQRIDSTGFDPAHANPDAFPVRTRYWIARRVLLDGKPLSEDVLKEYGRWRAFRPGFSSLPGNLAATFQPEGDGLSSSENPLDPQVGDLRIAWYALELPPLAGRVALEDGAWVPAQPAPQAADATGTAATPASVAEPATRSPARWAWIAAAAAAVLALLALMRKGRSRTPRGRQ